MSLKYRIIVLLLIFVVTWKGLRYLNSNSSETRSSLPKHLSDQNEQIKVTVYYEALCSDSRNFILKQLVPTYEALEKYIQLDLVPYGKAKTVERNGMITFQCQHAAVECEANKIHACVLDLISPPMMNLKYIACMINDNMIPDEVGERCAKELGIDYTPISDCAKSMKGSLLLKSYGIRTHAVSPTISFIPTIELDGQQKVPLARILKDFHKELCNLYIDKPIPCL